MISAGLYLCQETEHTRSFRSSNGPDPLYRHEFQLSLLETLKKTRKI